MYDEKGDYVTTVPVKAPGISDQEIGLADEDGDAVRLAGRRFDIRVEAPSVDGASFGKGILYLNYLDPKTLDRGEVAITVGGIDPDSLGYLKPPRLPSDAEVLVLVDNGGGFLSLGTYDIVFLAEGFQSSEKQEFYDQARDYLNVLLAREPWNTMRGLLRVRAIFRPSVDSGISNSVTGYWPPYKNTVYNTWVIKEQYAGKCPSDLTDWYERVAADRIAAGADFAVLIGNLDWRMGCTDIETEAFVGIKHPLEFRHEMEHTGHVYEEDNIWGETCSGSWLESFRNLTYDSSCKKWDEWLGEPGVGCFAGGGGSCSNAFHAGDACGMSLLNMTKDLCSVCREGVAVDILDESIFAGRKTPLIPTFTVREGMTQTFSVNVANIPYKIEWKVNSAVKATSGTSYTQTFWRGTYVITAEVTEDTGFILNKAFESKTKKTFTWTVKVDPLF